MGSAAEEPRMVRRNCGSGRKKRISGILGAPAAFYLKKHMLSES